MFHHTYVVRIAGFDYEVMAFDVDEAEVLAQAKAIQDAISWRDVESIHIVVRRDDSGDSLLKEVTR